MIQSAHLSGRALFSVILAGCLAAGAVTFAFDRKETIFLQTDKPGAASPQRAGETAEGELLAEAGGVRPEGIQYVISEKEANPALEKALLDILFQDEEYAPEGPDQFVRYLYNRVDLNRDGTPEVLVAVISSNFCGSGGCTGLILKRNGNTYRLLTELSLVRTPIVVAKEVTSGWHDLILFVLGGGATAHYARLKFDGRTYPDNPSLEPELPKGSVLRGTAYLADRIGPEAGLRLAPPAPQKRIR